MTRTKTTSQRPESVRDVADAVGTRRREANRRNALRSTGPRTAAGKLAASRNAIRHGLRADTPVVRGAEREADWLAHAAAVTASLAPVGYLEECLAGRVALQLWRLRRAIRYERETLGLLRRSAPDAVSAAREDRLDVFVKRLPTSLEGADDAIASWGQARSVLSGISDLDDGATLPGATIFVIGMLLTEVAGATTNEVRLNFSDGRSVLLDDLGLDRAPWPAAALPALAQTLAGDHGRDDLLSAAVEEATERQLLAEDARDDLVAEIGDLRRTRILPDGPELDKIARYETTLERSLFRALHELQRLQAARQGGIAPLALDVDLAV